MAGAAGAAGATDAAAAPVAIPTVAGAPKACLFVAKDEEPSTPNENPSLLPAAALEAAATEVVVLSSLLSLSAVGRAVVKALPNAAPPPAAGVAVAPSLFAAANGLGGAFVAVDIGG